MHYNLKRGEQVGIIRYGTWGDVSFQGTYIVTKCNMNVVEVKRESDGYVRSFSNRTGAEKNSGSRSADIISVEKYNAMKAREDARMNVGIKWAEIKELASKKDLDQLKKAIEELEAMQSSNLVAA